MKTKLFFISMFWISMTCFSQNTYVPDDIFENYLETHDANGNTVALGATNSMGNGIVNDDYVLTDNINTVAELNVNGLYISDLTGIADFTALTYLDCGWNNLISLDVSQNMALEHLNFGYNSLATIDLSQNTAITYLHCGFNSISNLDVSQNTALTTLICFENYGLSNLDVSQNTALTYLNCNLNVPLSTLDVSQNTALTYLDCSDTGLSTLDVSQNTALNYLNCNWNNLSTLDVSQNSVLTYLDCYNNNLSSLNVKNGNNTNFSLFVAFLNPSLTCIDVDDVTWSTTNWTSIDAQTSFSEDCSATYVPDDNFENYLETHDANGNTVALGATNSMGNGVANDDYVTKANINTVTDLGIRNRSISDLTGIEDFTALTYLDCSWNTLDNSGSLNVNQNNILTTLICGGNRLEVLDLSQNTVLTYLDCEFTELSSLDLSQNVALEYLDCSLNGNISNLDLSQNTALTYLNCWQNSLHTLDLSQNTALTYLDCSENWGLSTLDLSQNTALTALKCWGNLFLNTLDVSQNTALTYLDFNNGILSSLNVKNGNNLNFSYFNATYNMDLECIDVDDADWSTANWSSSVNNGTAFSEDCAALSVDDFSVSQFTMYPNPVRDILNLKLDDIANYWILNLNGQIIKKGKLYKGENQLNVSNFSNGIYFFKIETDDGLVTKKLVKH